MADLSRSANRRLAAQQGVASLDDLLDSGMTRWQIGDVVRRGGLIEVLPGAYRSAAVRETQLVRCIAVSRSRASTAIGGPTAAALLGIRRVADDGRIHVLAPAASNPSVVRWLVPYRTPTWSASDVVERPDGLRILRYPRLALDLARFVCDVDLLSIVEQCMRDGRCSDATMRRVAADWCTPQRPWVRRYLTALDRRVPGPAAESHIETIVGDRLRQAGVSGLERQFWIALEGYGRCRFDLAIPDIRWACEVDGFPTHRETNGAHADRRRDIAARRDGWLVRRVGPDDVGARLDETITFLIGDIAARRLDVQR